MRADHLGSTAAEIHVEDQEHDIIALPDEADRDHEANVESFRMLTPQGECVPLVSVAAFERTRTVSRVVRRDRHPLMGLPLTLPTVIGLASLAGIVVNDSIILMAFAKRHHAAGTPLVEAACKASTLRFRAVLQTSVTTIVERCPLL